MAVIYTEIQRKELEQLKQQVALLKSAIAFAEGQLSLWLEDPENNQYASLEDATELEDILHMKAHQDCEGSYNCGHSEYSQEFMVHDKRYVAKLENIQYNRHDKTYYFVDGFDFNIYPLL